MSYARRLDLRVFRRDPMRLLIAVRGADLTGSAPRLTVRQVADQAAPVLLALTPNATPAADGCRIADVATDAAGITTSIIEVLAGKAAIAALPAPPTIGGEAVLAYDLEWTGPAEGPGLTAVERTALFGSFIVMGSVND